MPYIHDMYDMLSTSQYQTKTKYAFRIKERTVLSCRAHEDCANQTDHTLFWEHTLPPKCAFSVGYFIYYTQNSQAIVIVSGDIHI